MKVEIFKKHYLEFVEKLVDIDFYIAILSIFMLTILVLYKQRFKAFDFEIIAT